MEVLEFRNKIIEFVFNNYSTIQFSLGGAEYRAVPKKPNNYERVTQKSIDCIEIHGNNGIIESRITSYLSFDNERRLSQFTQLKNTAKKTVIAEEQADKWKPLKFTWRHNGTNTHEYYKYAHDYELSPVEIYNNLLQIKTSDTSQVKFGEELLKPDFTNCSDELCDYYARCIIWRAIDLFAYKNFHASPAAPQPVVINTNFPNIIKLKCVEQNLYFSDSLHHTVGACISLKRNIILVGSPGCGKSRLAKIIAETIIGNEESPPKIVTASPSWSSDDVIGKYFPSPKNNEDTHALEFMPGFFLEALEENTPLIIDEFNRANMDECFGEMFTVLSGLECLLPFKDLEENKRIKLLPKNSRDNDNYQTYRIGDKFILIGTMNDYDRASLHSLSYALLRRFDVIRVDSPNAETLNTIINQLLPINEIPRPMLLFNHQVANTTQNLNNRYNEHIRMLFGIFKILSAKNIASVAILKDCVDFFKSGVSGITTALAENTAGQKFEKLVAIANSIFILSLITKVIPQLSIGSEKITQTVDVLNESDFGSSYYFVVDPINNNIVTTGLTIAQFFMTELAASFGMGNIAELKTNAA